MESTSESLVQSRTVLLKEDAFEGTFHIIWDMDDVLADFSSVFCEYIMCEKGESFWPGEGHYGLETMAIERGWLRDVEEFYRASWLLRLPQVKKGVETFRTLSSLGVKQHILTGRPSEMWGGQVAIDTLEWLGKNGISPDSVNFTRAKSSWVKDHFYMGNCIPKSIIIAIEDNPQYAAALQNAGCFTMLRSRHYNMTKEFKGIRFWDFNEALRMILWKLYDHKSYGLKEYINQDSGRN